MIAQRQLALIDPCKPFDIELLESAVDSRGFTGYLKP